MSSRTGVHTSGNRFKNVGIGDYVKFSGNSTVHKVVDKRTDVLSGVYVETYLFCDSGDFVRKVGHMDPCAKGVEILHISPALISG